MVRLPLRGCTVALAAFPLALAAGAGERVIDLQPGADTTLTGPVFTGETSDLGFFAAHQRTSGTELWFTDGTADGTRRVKDLASGPVSSGPNGFVAHRGDVVFSAIVPSLGRTLFRSDGTREGTQQLEHLALRPNVPDDGPAFVVSDRNVFFTVGRINVGGGLWWSNGRPGEARLIHDFTPGEPLNLTPLPHGRVLLWGWSEEAGREPWVSDGSAEGTRRIADLAAGPSDSRLVPPGHSIDGIRVQRMGNQALFFAKDDEGRRTLWKTDGTPDATIPLFVAPSGGFLRGGLVVAGSVAYFGEVVLPGGEAVPHRTDGTPEGTAPAPGALVEGVANEAGLVMDRRTRVSDGSETGPFLVSAELNEQPLPAGALVVETVVRGDRFFFTTGFADFECSTRFGPFATFVSDGTSAGTHTLLPERAFSLQPFDAGVLFQRAEAHCGDLPSHNGQPWISDGTLEGTRQLAAIASNSNDSEPSFLTRLGDRALFVATTDALGRELWSTDGTSAGTQPFLEPVGEGIVRGFATLDEQLALASERVVYDERSRPGSWTLKASDGSSEGGVTLLETASPVAVVALLAPNLLFLVAASDGTQLWGTDGTPGGTLRLADLGRAGEPSHVSVFARRDGEVFFIHRNASLPLEPQLWSTDGTPGGTRPRATFGPVPVVEPTRRFPRPTFDRDEVPLGFAGDHLLVQARSLLGRELYEIDIDTGAFHLVKNIRQPDCMLGSQGCVLPLLGQFVPLAGGRVFFAADDGASGREPWVSDGTEPGTFRLGDLLPGPGSSLPEPIFNDPDPNAEDPVAFGGRVFFRADDGVHGSELWVTDGTIEGTRMLMDLVPGALGSNPTRLRSQEGFLLFAAADPSAGESLFRSDGSAEGTVRITDAAFIASIATLPDQLLVSGVRDEVGHELIAADLGGSVPLAGDRLQLNRTGQHLRLRVESRDEAGLRLPAADSSDDPQRGGGRLRLRSGSGDELEIPLPAADWERRERPGPGLVYRGDACERIEIFEGRRLRIQCALAANAIREPDLEVDLRLGFAPGLHYCLHFGGERSPGRRLALRDAPAPESCASP